MNTTSLFARLRKPVERGQSLVELAISLTVILLLLSGAVSFGMALFSYVAIRDAAQEGALYGSFNPYADTGVGSPVVGDGDGQFTYTDSNGNGHYDLGEPAEPVNLAGIRERVRASSTSPVNLADTTLIPDSPVPYITAVATTGEACEGNTAGVPNGVQVTVKYDYPIFMPFVGAIVGAQKISLSATVTDTILEPRCP